MRKVFFTVLVWSFFSLLLFATDYGGKNTIYFFATSTTHKFHGRGEASISVREKTGSEALCSFEVSLPVQSLDTENRHRNSMMWAMFDQEHYPEIYLTASNIPLSRLKTDKGKGSLPLLLKIKNTEQYITAFLDHWEENGDSLSFEIEFQISLKQSGLKAPKLLFGLIRVADDVKFKSVISLKKISESNSD